MNLNVGEDFAARLDAAIARSQAMKLIEHQAPKVLSDEDSFATKIEGEAQEVSAAKLAQPINGFTRRKF